MQWKMWFRSNFDLTSRRGNEEVTHSYDGFDLPDSLITGFRQGRQKAIGRREISKSPILQTLLASFLNIGYQDLNLIYFSISKHDAKKDQYLTYYIDQIK